MEERRYRTRQEMIRYFETLADEFEKQSKKPMKRNDVCERWVALGKAEAYAMAAFELEHNMEG